MAKGSTWVHRLSDVDLEARTGICAKCGPVRVKVWNGKRNCLVAVNERRRAAQRHRPPRKRHRPPHGRRPTNLGYRITNGEYDERLAQQGDACAICRTDQWGPKGPQVDHDHTTGRVRGLLCRRCNIGLAWFKEDPDRLATAALYLQMQEAATHPKVNDGS